MSQNQRIASYNYILSEGVVAQWVKLAQRASALHSGVHPGQAPASDPAFC